MGDLPLYLSEQTRPPDHPMPDASLLSQVGRLFNSRLQIGEIVAYMARLVAERLDGDGVFFLVDASKTLLRPAAWHGHGPGRQALLARHMQGQEWPLTDFLPEDAARHSMALFAPETASMTRPLHAIWERLDAATFMAVPLRYGNEILGLIAVYRPSNEPIFVPADLTFLENLAPQAAAAIVNAQTLAGERWQRQKAELMFQASKAVHTELHFDQAVREIALLLKQSIKVPWVGILEYQPVERAVCLLGSTAEPAVDLRVGSQHLGLADWSSAAAVLEDDLAVAPIALPGALATAIGHPGASAWAFPLMHKQAPQGLLLLLARSGEEHFPNEAAEVAVGIAELVALAIANQHLIDQEAKARIQIIRSQVAAQEREVLLRQIVHDLRNATQAMSLVVEDMELCGDDNPVMQANLATLNSQITFISNFLKEKLTWFQQGERALTAHATPLAEVFADLEGRYGPAARAKNQRLVLSAPEPIKVPLSTVQLEQIIGNLLDNAIKYTPPHGEVRLWADHSDGWVTIYVADNGPGIAPADQPRLGEVGYRATREQDGAGLGLANVRQIVTRAGGLFGFSSPDGNNGTTFHVSLPTTAWGRVIS